MCVTFKVGRGPSLNKHNDITDLLLQAQFFTFAFKPTSKYYQ